MGKADGAEGMPAAPQRQRETQPSLAFGSGRALAADGDSAGTPAS